MRPLWEHPAFIDIYSQPLSEQSFETVSAAERFASGVLSSGVAFLKGGLTTLTSALPRVRLGIAMLQSMDALSGMVNGIVAGGGVLSSTAAAEGPLSALQCALELVLAALQDAEASDLDVDSDDAAVQRVCAALRGCIALASELPVGSRDPRKAVDFVSALVARVEQLPPHGAMLVPAGWLGGEGETPRLMLLSIARRTGGDFEVWICNASEGLEYHAVRADEVCGAQSLHSSHICIGWRVFVVHTKCRAPLEWLLASISICNSGATHSGNPFSFVKPLLWLVVQIPLGFLVFHQRPVPNCCPYFPPFAGVWLATCECSRTVVTGCIVSSHATCLLVLAITTIDVAL